MEISSKALENSSQGDAHKFVQEFMEEMLPIDRLLSITQEKIGSDMFTEKEKGVVHEYGANSLKDQDKSIDIMRILADMKAACDGEDLIHGLIASTMLSIIYTFHAKGAITFQELQALDEKIKEKKR